MKIESSAFLVQSPNFRFHEQSSSYQKVQENITVGPVVLQAYAPPSVSYAFRVIFVSFQSEVYTTKVSDVTTFRIPCQHFQHC